MVFVDSAYVSVLDVDCEIDFKKFENYLKGRKDILYFSKDYWSDGYDVEFETPFEFDDEGDIEIFLETDIRWDYLQKIQDELEEVFEGCVVNCK